MSAQDCEKIVHDWRRAYQIANGKSAPVMRYKSGWFVIEMGTSVRRADVIKWTEMLLYRAQAKAAQDAVDAIASNARGVGQ